MGQIFAECQRVLKADGLMTLMFTHKSKEAWEVLTRSLIESGWTISASFPVESEVTASMHQKNMDAAVSSIFLACRKREQDGTAPALWTGLAGQGVQHRARILDLLDIWAAELVHPDLKREAETLRFGLRPMAA